MNVFEWTMVVVFTACGVRSAWVWGRRPFAGRDVLDHLLYALTLTGRVGLWFAFAGLWGIFLSVQTQGRAFTDDVNDHRWYLLVLLGLAAMQFVGGQLLGRRRVGDDDGSVTRG